VKSAQPILPHELLRLQAGGLVETGTCARERRVSLLSVRDQVLLALKAPGRTVRSVASEFGVSYTNLSRALKKWGRFVYLTKEEGVSLQLYGSINVAKQDRRAAEIARYLRYCPDIKRAAKRFHMSYTWFTRIVTKVCSRVFLANDEVKALFPAAS
jgi:DNA-binding transcriptional ArsR family regulator